MSNAARHVANTSFTVACKECVQEERKRRRRRRRTRRRRRRKGLINLENDNPPPDCHNGVLSSQWLDTGESKGMRVRRTICEILTFRVSLKRWTLVYAFLSVGLP